MAFVPFTKDEQPTMAAFNEKFEQAIGQALADGVKIEVGSYVGTGKYGSSNKNSISINKTTQLVIVQAGDPSKTGGEGYYWMLGIRGNTSSTLTSISTSNLVDYRNTLVWGEETLSWYDDDSAYDQLNTSGVTYRYVAIG